jgi:DNA-binding response OmpR family regulator
VSPPPRVLIVLDDHWPRALARAALRELGYDAIGARTLREALAHPKRVPDRGPVGALVLDERAVAAGGAEELAALRTTHDDPPTVLLASGTHPTPRDGWARVLRRPFSVDDVVEAVRALLPLEAGSARPVDE